MAIFLPSSVDSCGGGNGIFSRGKGGLPLLFLRRKDCCKLAANKYFVFLAVSRPSGKEGKGGTKKETERETRERQEGDKRETRERQERGKRETRERQ